MPTSHLPTLLKRYEALIREIARLETTRTAVHDQILAVGRTTVRPRRGRATPIAAGDELRAILRVLQEAEAPLPPREVASRLGVPPKTASRRLARALHLGYVERAGQACYRVAAAVPPGL